MSDMLDRCLDASLLITRAASGRHKARKALYNLKRHPKSFAWLRNYVAAAAMTEEAELELLSIKRRMAND